MQTFKTFTQKRKLADDTIRNPKVGKKIILQPKDIVNDEEYFKITKMWDEKHPKSGRTIKKIKMDWAKGGRSGTSELRLDDIRAWLTA